MPQTNLASLNQKSLDDRIITLTADNSAARLDRFVVEALPAQSVTRGAVQRLIEEGLITVNGKPSKASYKIRPGDAIVVHTRSAPPGCRPSWSRRRRFRRNSPWEAVPSR